MERTLMFDIETTSLFSSSGIVVAIGIFDPSQNQEPLIKFCRKPEEEKELLEWFKEVAKSYSTLCGWNSKRFDLPFLAGRALLHGVDFSEVLKLQHLDLMEVSKQNFKFRLNSLSSICRLLGIEYDTSESGESISLAYLQSVVGKEEFQKKIEQKCIQDLKALAKVFEKFKPYLEIAKNKSL